MIIEDFKSVFDSKSDRNIEVILNERHENDANEFWIFWGGEKFPAMSVLVKKDLAILHYFERGQDPGMVSISQEIDLDPRGLTGFYLNGTELQDMPNDMIISFPLALQAVKEFSMKKEPPLIIKWLKL